MDTPSWLGLWTGNISSCDGTRVRLSFFLDEQGLLDEHPLNAEEVERQIKVDYEKKLKIDSIRIPDPFKIPQGWQNEEEGIIFWPMLLYPDIFNYLMFYPSELGSKDLSDYKNSKAYSYYTNGWLQPLLYHPLSGSPYCVLKGECQKSQSIRESMHKLWIVVEKDPVKIRSCHCTCMAGMGQTCNHVASAMYRVEAAVRNGLTNPSCTSSLFRLTRAITRPRAVTRAE